MNSSREGLLFRPTELEERWAAELKEVVEAKVRKNRWDEYYLANMLGLLPSGVLTLFAKTRWSLRMAVRVVIALGIECSLVIKKE